MIHHNFRRLAAGFGLSLLLGACGATSLSVTVSVLDPAYLERYRTAQPIESVRSGARLARDAITDGPLSEASIEAATDAVKAATEKALGSEALASIKNSIPDGLQISATTARFTSAALKDVRKSLQDGIRLVEEAQSLREHQIDLALKLYGTASVRLGDAKNAAANVAANIQAALTQDLEVVVQSEPDETKRPAIRAAVQGIVDSVRESVRAETAPQRTVTQAASGDYLGDPLLGYVVKAPAEHWTGRLNIAAARANGTDSDLAIVMEDIAKFSVKGLRANSAAATAATFATLGRVMSIAAVASGVPVPGQVQAGKAPGAMSVEALLTNDRLTSKTQIEEQIKAARRRLVRLLDAVLQEGKTELNAPDNDLCKRIAVRLDTEKK